MDTKIFALLYYVKELMASRLAEIFAREVPAFLDWSQRARSATGMAGTPATG